ncbi:unnamed protein product, partial [Discosporangium mesarthrocarpum]
SCDLGIESTVCKVDSEQHQLLLYRRGAVSRRSLEGALQELDLGHYRVEVCQKVIAPPADEAKSKDILLPPNSTIPAATGDVPHVHGQGQQAPGQLVSHYAPDVATILIRADKEEDAERAATVSGTEGGCSGAGECASALASELMLKTSVVVLGFGRHLSWLEGRCLAFRNLSTR